MVGLTKETVMMFHGFQTLFKFLLEQSEDQDHYDVNGKNNSHCDVFFCFLFHVCCFWLWVL